MRSPALLTRNALALAITAASLTAVAQEGPRALEEIIVTATKRSETVQEIPASISAITADSLSDRGLASVQDIAMAVPNLNWGEHFGTTLITIRGVGSTVDSGITEPTVAMYVDGVFLPRSTMSVLRAVDLERIEVLRGPQGTLYGRNATGGAINFISKDPSTEFEAGINLSTGARDAYGFSGYISSPINDVVSFRLSGGREKQDGYVRVRPGNQLLGGTDVEYVRGVLRVAPSDELTIDLAVRSEVNKSPNGWQQLLTPTAIPTPGQTTDANRIIADQPFRQRVETTISSLTLNWDLSDSVSLRSITSYVDHESSIDVDADSTDQDFFNTVDFYRPSRSWSQEVTLNGDAGRVSWIAGAFYFTEDSMVRLPLRVGAVGAPVLGLPAGGMLAQGVESESESYALFSDVTFEITDSLRVVGGLRYNHEEQDFVQETNLDMGGGMVLPLFLGNFDEEQDKLLPKIALQYDITQDINMYAQWSRGIKSGGLNLSAGTGFYKPEEITAYEIGLKTQLLDNSLTANFAAFYYDYTDLQITNTIPPTTTLVQNADANIYGVEAELLWVPTDRLTVNFAATYTEAKFDGFSAYDDATPGLGVQDLDGEYLPHAPKFTANLGIEYSVPLGISWLSDLTLRADAMYTDDVVLRYFPLDIDIEDSYVLGNLSAKISDVNENTSLSVFVNNVGDVEYKQNVTYIGPAEVNAFMGNYGPPRTWGMQLSHRF